MNFDWVLVVEASAVEGVVRQVVHQSFGAELGVEDARRLRVHRRVFFVVEVPADRKNLRSCVNY